MGGEGRGVRGHARGGERSEGHARGGESSEGSGCAERGV